MEENNDLGEFSESITLAQLRKFYKKFKNYADDTPISFEMLMVAFFPTMFNNIQEFGTKKYIKGYNQGLEDAKNENKGNNGRVLH